MNILWQFKDENRIQSWFQVLLFVSWKVNEIIFLTGAGGNGKDLLKISFGTVLGDYYRPLGVNQSKNSPQENTGANSALTACQYT